MVAELKEPRVTVYKLHPINRKQATVLSGLDLDEEVFRKHVDWVGSVKFDEGEREMILGQLEEKGWVTREGEEFKLTPKGKDQQIAVDITFLKED